MTSALQTWGQQWLEWATLATLQSSLFLVLVLGALYACRHCHAGFLRVLALIGLFKLLVPPVFRFATPHAVLQPLESAVVRFNFMAAPQGAAAPSWPAALLLAWLATATLFIAFSVVSTVRLRRHVAKARRVDVTKYLDSHEVPARIEFFETRENGSPMVIGFWRHRVVLPASWRTWTPGCVRAVLLHETAHVRRGDHWVQAVQTLALALHFFNPLAWMLHNRLSRLSELSCDDATIARSGIEPATYARHLLRVAEDIAPAPRLLPARMVVSDRGHSLRQRLRYLLAAPTARGRLFWLRAAPLVGVLVTAMVPLSGNMDSLQSAPPVITRVTELFRGKAIVEPASPPRSSTQRDGEPFVAARPVAGYGVLGKYLSCPCSVEDHSVCPRGRIVYGHRVRRKGIVVAVHIASDGHVTSARLLENRWARRGFRAEDAIAAILEVDWEPARLAGRALDSRLEIAFHAGQY